MFCTLESHPADSGGVQAHAAEGNTAWQINMRLGWKERDAQASSQMNKASSAQLASSLMAEVNKNWGKVSTELRPVSVSISETRLFHVLKYSP